MNFKLNYKKLPKPDAEGFVENFKAIFDGSVLTGKTFTSQTPFIFFMVFLALIYIFNRYKAEGAFLENARLQKEIKDLRTESMGLATELMHISNQTNINVLTLEKIEGLKESVEPPKKIVFKKD